MSRPLYSRSDLDRLKTFTREQILQTFGSFDERMHDKKKFILQTANLLDSARISGLSEAVKNQDIDAILQLVYTACQPQTHSKPSAEIDAETLQLAEDVLNHKFKFYTETHQLPETLDWDFNPGTAHWTHDLNRFSYLSLLTRAYFATKDTRFSRKAVAFMLDWINKCHIEKCFVGTPYMFGSYLNNAIHSAAWARCLQQLLPENQVEPFELMQILKSLHDQMAYLEIVTNGHAGNWPTIGCQGILQILSTLPIFRDTDRFITYCIGTFSKQIDQQVLPDGVQDELTPHYHAGVASNLLSAIESLQTLHRTLEDHTLKTLRAMVHYQQQTVVPNASAQVAFNDSDPESVPQTAARIEKLGLGNLLSPSEKLGPETFPYAGVAFLRQKATDGDLYLAFDGGPFGRSHQHEDKLGFWLYAYGRNFIVDPGRHLYDHSAVSFFDYLRSTKAHSTICIDGQDQNSRNLRDTWIAKEPNSLIFSISDGEVRAASAYDLGYGENNAIRVVHRREVVFVHNRFWIIFDRAEGTGEHRVDSRFQFYPGQLQQNGSQITTTYPDANLLLWSLASWNNVQITKGQENPRSGWYSPSYSRIEPAPCVTFSTTTSLPFVSATLLFPYKGTEKPMITFSRDGKIVHIENREIGKVQVETTLG